MTVLLVASALAVGTAGAEAAGLVASVDAADPGGALGTTVLVSSRPAVIVSTPRLADARPGCDAQALGPGTTAQASFTPPDGLVLDGSKATQAAVLSEGESDGRVNAVWHVRTDAVALGAGRVRWQATSRTGQLCTTAQRVRIVVAGRAPTLETHALGRTERGLLDLLRPDRVDQVVVGSVDFDARGRGCLRVSDPRRRTRLGHHLAFRWNGELGARPVTRPGTIRVDARPTIPDARSCATAFAADPATRRAGER